MKKYKIEDFIESNFLAELLNNGWVLDDNSEEIYDNYERCYF